MSEAVKFLETPGGEDLAVLPRKEYEELLDAAEDAEDAALTRERRDEPTLPLEVVLEIRSGNLHPLTAWRKATGMTQAQLAEKVDVRAATISDIEQNKSPGVSLAVMHNIARALGLRIDDLVTGDPD